ncbi:MAG: hypothetical protein K2X03_17695 [Bryobacteraceae bacterium]|nr:hypothetical protein [Bryobacteraceae bacterium]
MRLLLCLSGLALSALAQGRLSVPGSGLTIQRPAPPVHRNVITRPGYWGGGFWGFPPRVEIVQPPPPPEPKTPVLVSSPLYQADKAKPEMREYGGGTLPPSQTVAGQVAIIAFQDGRVEPVWAYWAEGDQLAYVVVGDQVRKAPLKSVDASRSEKLNQQRGIVFRAP